MMNYLEYMEEALSELKRAEHSIFISLKYARTKDIIDSIISRIKSSYENMFDALYGFYYETKAIDKKVKTYIEKINLVNQHVDSVIIYEAGQYYRFLKHLEKKPNFIENKFRRYFGIIYFLEGNNSYMLDIDQITQWLKKLKEHFISCEDVILKEEEYQRANLE